MNYSDEILQNKYFDFFKQLMYNIALSICIMLIGVLLMVYCAGFKLYEVMSGSEEPHLPVGCMAIVKPKDKYEVGDILTFTQGESTVTHRLIGIYQVDGKNVYVCHGDNVQAADPFYEGKDGIQSWKKDAEYIQSIIDQYGSITSNEIDPAPRNCQAVPESDAIGVVVGCIGGLGSVVTFVKGYYMLVITLVVGIWCVSNVIQNELDIKRSRRLV